MKSGIRAKSKSGTVASQAKPTTSQEGRPDESASFPIVGIGASAGGLAAIKALFSGMPIDVSPNMAFVIVQHLAPDHKSILTEIIQHFTNLRVFEVEDGMVVQQNCAYIIPPDRDMAFLNGALQLMQPSATRGLRLPIDFFFRSLAQDQRERAICIVLSGTGSDGTQGLRAIKGEGGMAMAQDPVTTEFDGMPRSAISTGLVDYVLPPAEMAAQLIAYAAHFHHRPSVRPTRVPQRGDENELRKIHVLIRAQTGHDFSQYKPSTIMRRVERRMAVNQVDTIVEYLSVLQQSQTEVAALFRDLLIGVTSFFRDAESFGVLEQTVIPAMVAATPDNGVIRVWSAGCSTGEEAYSLAILFNEQLERDRRNCRVQIFATDIDSHAIAIARNGSYAASVASDISPERWSRFFVTESNGTVCRIHKSIRDMVVFSEQDIVRDPPFSRLALICCRNLLIYMDSELQQRLIRLFHYALNPGGTLFLGASETVGGYTHFFEALDQKSKLFRRDERIRLEYHGAPGRFQLPEANRDATFSPSAGKTGEARGLSPRELIEKELLQHFAPIAALVNERGDIIYLHGRGGLFLEPVPGESGINNILKMAREGLQNDLHMALRNAVSTMQIVRTNGLRVKTNGDFTGANLTIRPVAAGADATSKQHLFVVILEPEPLSEPAPHQARPDGTHLDSDSDTRIASLMQALQSKEEYLLASTEELETANEELKSANEELQSVNEELQSSNEELETSKEELQSMNEELITVNAELQEKVRDLSQVNSDMNNLLSGTGIGTVFVDHQMRILRFTPFAAQIINLIASDLGRPVNHIATNLINYDRLVEDVKSVLDSLIPIEREVQVQSGGWYTMRILPYRTIDNVIEGAVITFVNIADIKKAPESSRKTSE